MARRDTTGRGPTVRTPGPVAALAAALLLCVAARAAADQVVADDLVVQGGTCAGFDCVNAEAFGPADTLRLKENNLRILLLDTSPAGLPGEDWQIRANSSTSGGPSHLSILGGDTNPTRTQFPFTISAGAPDDALRLGSGGVAVGAAAPTPGTALDVRGGLVVRGDLQVTGRARGGYVPKSAFTRRVATVAFDAPYPGDYAIQLTAASASREARFRPVILSRSATGFTFSCGGSPRYLQGVHWATRAVGEY